MRTARQKVHDIVSWNRIRIARKIMRDAFEKDPEFKHTYIANVAIIIYEHFGTEHDARGGIAEKIIDRIFAP